MEATLDWISGISWMLVYVIAIYLGIQRKTYCIPGICICLNFSWEMLAVLVRVIQHSPLNSGFVSQLLWLIWDVGVLYTWIRFSDRYTWRKMILFSGMAIIMVLTTLGLSLWEVTAFTINLIMSVTFLFQLDKQVYPSVLIALLKCVGTLAATVLNGVVYRNYLILAIGGLCLFADLCYLYEIWKCKATANE